MMSENVNKSVFIMHFTTFLQMVAIAIVLFIYTMIAGGTTHGRSPNEQSRVELAVALAQYGSVSIDPVLPVYGTPFDRSVRDQKNYSDKAPGLSFLGVPIVWIADLILPREGNTTSPSYWGLRHLMTWFLIVLPAGLFPFLALNRYTPVPRYKIEISLLFALVTPILTYAGVFFGHVPAGILAALAWMLTIEVPNQNLRQTSGNVALAGFLLAFATIIEYPTAIVGLVIFVSMAFRRFSLFLLFLFVGTCFLGIIPCLIYHQLAFGSPFTTGYAFKSDWWHGSLHQAGFFGISIPSFESLWGILIGTKRGILFYSPILLLIPLGLRQMERQTKGSSLPYITLAILYLWFASGFSDWQAGWSAAARHLLPCVLIFIFPFANAILFFVSENQNKRIYTFILFCVASFSLTTIFLSISLTPFFPEHFSSPIGQLVLPAMAEGYFAPTLLVSMDTLMRGYFLLLLWFLCFGAVSFCLTKLLGPFKYKIILPMAILIVSIAYGCLIWGLASPLTEEERQVRGDVLRHIGYTQTGNPTE